jgi:hypothetical protein
VGLGVGLGLGSMVRAAELLPENKVRPYSGLEARPLELALATFHRMCWVLWPNKFDS